MPDFTHVNWLAVIIAAVASIAIGFVWYMPAVFGRRWAAETGIELPGGGDASPMTWVYGIVQALLIAYVIALFAAEADIAGGIVIGAVLWLGFVATTKFNSVVFERRSTMYWVIDGGYHLVSMVTMGAMIGYFPPTM